MYSKTPTGKNTKGTPSLESFQGRLRIRFRINGQQKAFSLGLADNAENRLKGESIAREMHLDMLSGNWDSTLGKYKPHTHLAIVEAIKPKASLDLAQLWEKYSEFKKPQVSPSTYAKDFTKHRNHINRLPSKSLEEAELIRDYLLANLSPDAARRVLTQLKACCDWALAEKLIPTNPFHTMKIKTPQGLSEDSDIYPFTKEERDLIIKTFAANKHYSYYTNFVRFLFFTGCRPSEAIALQWKHIENGVIKFQQSVVISENGLVLKEGLKTQRKRDFPINTDVQLILNDTRPETINPEDFIFTSPKGKFIDQHNFANRAWKTILEECKIPYRKAYQTRHTFISLCVEAHINSTAISRWTGTSSKMIDNHYGATNFTNLRPPSLI
ncbi:site-specific integrase [Aetokthonos hydrillicola Thurmond2011]|jgi:integrase|uniref:Site-specific integrase n=1 Tax=Aetokthonos hydrillicola Thurmond2011 TaxID=2712845 RepID=A0AAP5MCL6_9CYAN|nr:site-specific integrase [Aetokthonos hydrillicola]MBO3461993.1 tyrosine-type recombinase/integrase [Aetokthonos hydrillicola CCALA 1050]MBW4584304.1 site-specific integrase [Aetokthonos hydrillicola CCALA 1050]MDR9898488.1 site-specific integrase [Aetokthonos hydrillicola Thurmond2011]